MGACCMGMGSQMLAWQSQRAQGCPAGWTTPNIPRTSQPALADPPCGWSTGGPLSTSFLPDSCWWLGQVGGWAGVLCRPTSPPNNLRARTWLLHPVAPKPLPRQLGTVDLHVQD